MDVRNSAAFISSQSKHVSIQPSGIEKLVNLMYPDFVNRSDSDSILTPWSKLVGHPKPTDQFAVDWIFVADAINFSFWSLDSHQFVVSFEGQPQTGYFALSACLTRAVQHGIPICDPNFYSTVSLNDLKQIFMDDDGIPIPMLEERQQNLHECGKKLLEEFNGTFLNCVQRSEHSAEKLLRLIVDHFPCFRDIATFDGAEVSFLKRAQILVADLWNCFEGQDIGAFTDIEYITAFADYRVPQVLRFFGALEYSEELEQVLREGQMICSGDRMEVEIRGCSIHAVELITQELKKRVQNMGEAPTVAVNSIVVDNYLWLYRRRFAKELASVPFHRTRTIYY